MRRHVRGLSWALALMAVLAAGVDPGSGVAPAAARLSAAHANAAGDSGSADDASPAGHFSRSAHTGAASEVEVEFSLYAGGRVAESWPTGDGGGGPGLQEPRAGYYTSAGLHVQTGAWTWALSLAAGGLEVPFKPADGRWEPSALGLAFPPDGRARPDALWVEYDRGSSGGWVGGWSAWLGRRPLEIGGGTGLIGFGRAPGLDQVGVSVGVGSAEYRKIVARLSPGERYLLAHQLTLGPFAFPWGAVRLSGYELGVVSPRFASLFVTWIPLWPGYLTQHLRLGGVTNNDANFYIGLAAALDRSSGRLRRIEAELLVDDMPQLPWIPQVYQLGGRVRVRLGESWALQYTRVHNFVITFQEPQLSLIHDGRLLAYPDGPDTDSLFGEWQAASGTRWSLEWRRRGIGRLGDVWEPDLQYGKAREFLSGPVEHAVLAGVTVRIPAGAELAVQAGPVWNAANVSGTRALFVGAGLRFTHRAQGQTAPSRASPGS